MFHFSRFLVGVMVVCLIFLSFPVLGEAFGGDCYVKYFRIEEPFSLENGGRICVGVSDRCIDDSSENSFFLTSENILSETKIKSTKGCVEIKPDALKEKEAGSYTFTVKNHKKKTIYEQGVIIESDASCGNEDKRRNIEGLIKKHAPILKFDTEEQYYPISLETLFNKCETTGYAIYDHSKDTFHNIKFSDIDKDYKKSIPMHQIVKYILANRGSANSGIKFDGKELLYKNLKSSTVYASYKTYPQDHRLAIQYWFFYPYDPKQEQNRLFSDAHKRETISDPFAEHHGDWEMVTIGFSQCNSDFSICEPEKMGFSEHVPHQKIECVSGDCRKYLTKPWEKPGMAVPWKYLEKQDERPFVFIARGSHASYPYAGKYKVTDYNIYKYKITVVMDIFSNEKADGNLSEYSYHMHVLPRMCEISSDSRYGWLLFSGRIKQGAITDNFHQIYFPPHQVVDFGHTNAIVNRWVDPLAWVEALAQFPATPEQDEPTEEPPPAPSLPADECRKNYELGLKYIGTGKGLNYFTKVKENCSGYDKLIKDSIIQYANSMDDITRRDDYIYTATNFLTKEEILTASAEYFTKRWGPPAKILFPSLNSEAQCSAQKGETFYYLTNHLIKVKYRASNVSTQVHQLKYSNRTPDSVKLSYTDYNSFTLYISPDNRESATSGLKAYVWINHRSPSFKINLGQTKNRGCTWVEKKPLGIGGARKLSSD